MSIILVSSTPSGSRVPIRRTGLLGVDPTDILLPAIARELQEVALNYYPELVNQQTGALRRGAVSSQAVADKDKFQINVDVQQFKPEEIAVKVTGDNELTVEGKHEERPDEHGCISRHFKRRYVLSKDYDINRIESRLSSDGVLTITAPKVSQGQMEHRTIPITRTGQPSRPVEQKQDVDSTK